MTAKKTPPAKKAAARPAAPAPKAGPKLVTWADVLDEETGATQVHYGLVLEDGLEIGEGDRKAKGTRVAVLDNLRVVDPQQLKTL